MIEDFIKDYKNKSIDPIWINSIELLTPNFKFSGNIKWNTQIIYLYLFGIRYLL